MDPSWGINPDHQKPAFRTKIACQIPSPQKWRKHVVEATSLHVPAIYGVSLPGNNKNIQDSIGVQQNVQTIKIYNQVKKKVIQCSKKYPEHVPKFVFVFHVSDLHLKQKHAQHTPGNSARKRPMWDCRNVTNFKG